MFTGALKVKATWVLFVLISYLVKSVGASGTVAAKITKDDVDYPSPTAFLAWILKL